MTEAHQRVQIQNHLKHFPERTSEGSVFQSLDQTKKQVVTLCQRSKEFHSEEFLLMETSLKKRAGSSMEEMEERMGSYVFRNMLTFSHKGLNC